LWCFYSACIFFFNSLARGVSTVPAIFFFSSLVRGVSTSVMSYYQQTLCSPLTQNEVYEQLISNNSYTAPVPTYAHTSTILVNTFIYIRLGTKPEIYLIPPLPPSLVVKELFLARYLAPFLYSMHGAIFLHVVQVIFPHHAHHLCSTPMQDSDLHT
jgi:hypothetical protein